MLVFGQIIKSNHQHFEHPYPTRAAIMEVQRFADIAPTGLIHKTVCDVSIEGFELPQVGMMTHTADDYILS